MLKPDTLEREREHERCSALDDALSELLSDCDADQLERVLGFVEQLRAEAFES